MVGGNGGKEREDDLECIIWYFNFGMVCGLIVCIYYEIVLKV